MASPVTRAALECRVDARLSVLIAIEAVNQVIDVELSPPPPLAGPWIGGFALHGGSVLAVIALSGDPERRRARAGKGVWLTTAATGLGWLLEVESVASFVHARVQPARYRGRALPDWLSAAQTSDARELAWLDVDAMVAAMGAA